MKKGGRRIRTAVVPLLLFTACSAASRQRPDELTGKDRQIQLANGEVLLIPEEDVRRNPEVLAVVHGVNQADAAAGRYAQQHPEADHVTLAEGQTLLRKARDSAAANLKLAYYSRTPAGDPDPTALATAVELIKREAELREARPPRAITVVTDLTSDPAGVLEFTPADDTTPVQRGYQLYARGQLMRRGAYLFKVTVPGRSEAFKTVYVWEDPTVGVLRIPIY